MSLTDEFQRRLTLYAIDDGMQTAMQEAWKLLEPYVGEATADNVRLSGRMPSVAKLMAEKGDAIAKLNGEFTRKLFQSGFGEQWGQDARDRFEAEAKIGLDARNRPALSRMIASKLFPAIGRRYWYSGRKAAELTEKVARVLMLDVANAFSFHVAEQIRQAAGRGEQLDAAIKEFEGAITGIRNSIEDVTSSLNETAGALAVSAEIAGDHTKRATGAAQNASSNVTITAGATEELATSVSEIYEQVRRSVEMARKAVADAERTNATIRSLSESVEKIGSVVGMISDIAAQTNLLALNATIEAARAGEAGRGFAVVASEVKELANQTSKATEDIGHQISAVQGVTRQSVGEITTIGETITSIASIAETIVQSVDRQAQATGSISGNVQEAASNAQNVTAALEPVGEAVVRTDRAAQAVLEFSRKLADNTSQLGQAFNVLFKRVRG